MNLRETLGFRKKTRAEKVQDTLSDAIETVADTLDTLVERHRKPTVARRARKQFKQVSKATSKAVDRATERAVDVAESVRDQSEATAGAVREVVGEKSETLRERVSEATETLHDRASEGREKVGKAASESSSEVNAKLAAAIAALSGLSLNWDEIAKSLSSELEETLGTVKEKSEEKSEEASEKVRKARKGALRKMGRKRSRRFPGLWLWLLRIGVGLFFIERLRNRDIAAYVEHGAGDEMREQTREHPVTWYKDLLDTLFIPNASIFASIKVAAEAVAATGFVTGLNRRFAALTALMLSANELIAEARDPEKRSQSLVLVLVNLLLLRTGS